VRLSRVIPDMHIHHGLQISKLISVFGVVWSGTWTLVRRYMHPMEKMAVGVRTTAREQDAYR